MADAQLPMRVALVHDWLVGMRGGEKVLEAFASLFPKAHIHTLFCDQRKLSPALRRMKIQALWKGHADQYPLKLYRNLLPIYPQLVGRLKTSDYDLVISTSHCVAHGCPSPKNGLHLGYIFTPMRYIWDQHDQYLGKNPVKNLALKTMRGPLQNFDRAAAQRVDHYVADSQHIAAKIERFWNRKADVIYPHVDLKNFQPDPKANREKFLIVSALVPYKRVDRAIEAARISKVPLTIIGDGPERENLEAQAPENVEFRGWVSRKELISAYQNAKAFLFPGEEDFGITPLEAMACGTPVVALGRGGVTETVTPPDTGVFFDHEDDKMLAEVMAETLANFRYEEHYLETGPARAGEFSLDGFRTQAMSWVVEQWSKRCF